MKLVMANPRRPPTPPANQRRSEDAKQLPTFYCSTFSRSAALKPLFTAEHAENAEIKTEEGFISIFC